MSNFGFISKKKVAREIAKIYRNHKGADLFDSGACSALNFLCTELKPCNECPRQNCVWCSHYKQCLEEGLMVEE